MGDLDFEPTETIHNTNSCHLKNAAVIPIVSELLGVDGKSLGEALTSNTVVTRGESIVKENSAQEAESTRDAMSKVLYGRLFDWIVNQINRLLNPSKSQRDDLLTLGLLDIFGFENFKSNSMEQLMINIANEQIQFYFNQHIFKMEQQEYLNEEIPVSVVTFNDNRPLLDLLLNRPMGLLALLDEESHFPNATDTSLVDKFHNNLRSPNYVRPKGNSLNFTVCHYAGKVQYDARNFLEKNRFYIPLEIIQLHRQSSIPLIRSLFGSPLTKTGHLFQSSSLDLTSQENGDVTTTPSSTGLVSQTKAQQTVSTYFRLSLLELLQKLNRSSPHFVRCLKPNDSKKPQTFVVDKIIEQLNYTGIMETIAIRRQGYSHRIAYPDFVARYAFLAFSFDEEVIPNKETARLLMLRLHLDGYALGRTKLFLKYYHIEFLSREYERQLKKIIKVQSYARRWLAKRKAFRIKQIIIKQLQDMQKQKKFTESQQPFQRHPQPMKHNVGWLGRKRGPALENKAPDPRNNKSANRQDSPDLPSSGKDRSKNPNKAAILIQKCVRGYLTRKKVKAHQTKEQMQHQKLEMTKNSIPHFQATRMQLYQNQQQQKNICQSTTKQESKIMPTHLHHQESRMSSHERRPIISDNK